ncbi:hypothetical protein Q1695_010727 [Nippostrongylus brasiliensis]|nr:hypothetical protein Q1695_010727 [Nippostrongylus brasiliensis]
MAVASSSPSAGSSPPSGRSLAQPARSLSRTRSPVQRCRSSNAPALSDYALHGLAVSYAPDKKIEEKPECEPSRAERFSPVKSVEPVWLAGQHSSNAPSAVVSPSRSSPPATYVPAYHHRCDRHLCSGQMCK